ncbi:ZZ-type zinc finger-containing protein 3 [Araneus ventricosus]|uniref:ZZ-type zinc finger-containing protein 3 n=1 Tax=Araneus ventricosus TaxID=182803 RepID=A0A4Y2BZ72_ARAVE|nr:ZZ-type zinc finger-containing protein 3 [Araneus ventricosus]
MEHSAAIEIEQEEYIDVETPDIPTSQNETRIFSDRVTLSDKEMMDILDDPANKPPEIDYDSIGEFCFESDQLALKGNSDYKNVLEAIVVLEAQRAQAVKDIERLGKLKREALADPFEFLERLRRKEDMNFPVPQKIHPVPVVDWSKYALSGNPTTYERRQISLHKQMSQNLSRNNAKGKLNSITNDSKSAEIYQPWTDEEQKRLKELLNEFPPEKAEVHRWEKIANGLGTRTPLEVATRVHKFYSSLAEDDTINLGNIPDLTFLRKYWHTGNTNEITQDQKQNVEHLMESQADVSDDEEISPELRDTAEYRELIFLKKLLREKVLEESNSLIPHIGYKCCRCKTEPIVGVRWHCTECPPSLCMDFCDDCSQSMHETAQHSADHHLEKVYASKGFVDRDYMHFLGNDYNYLDPNYMPAT